METEEIKWESGQKCKNARDAKENGIYSFSTVFLAGSKKYGFVMTEISA